ncbi:MAG: calpain-6 [Micavibrio sp.]|nr:calpain-6 [Micavibrio sp.]
MNRNLAEELSFPALDTNNDGVLSYQEMSQLNPEQLKQIQSKYQEDYNLLSLDSNGDGRLTAAELELQARQAFKIIDLDNNGILSELEIQPFLAAAQSAPDSPASCKKISSPQNSKLISIGIFEGASFSSVTAYDQDTVTTATTVNIPDNSAPLYLVLSSVEPVIWQIKGNTRAVIGATVVGSVKTRYDLGANGVTASGITGLSKEIVKFPDSTCIPNFYIEKDASAVKSLTAITHLAGRKPDIAAGDQHPETILINSDRVFFQSPQETAAKPLSTPLVKGYDQRLWLQVLRYHPAGVSIIDPASVVSMRHAENYLVMPAMAGIAKLVNEGYLAPIGPEIMKFMVVRGEHVLPEDPRMSFYSSFRVVKTPPRYPPGMIIDRVNFIFPKGVPVPPGDPANSCVISEETGQQLNHNFICDK